jgi:hypothetical protein
MRSDFLNWSRYTLKSMLTQGCTVHLRYHSQALLKAYLKIQGCTLHLENHSQALNA